jgi:hypothetical protein
MVSNTMAVLENLQKNMCHFAAKASLDINHGLQEAIETDARLRLLR